MLLLTVGACGYPGVRLWDPAPGGPPQQHPGRSRAAELLDRQLNLVGYGATGPGRSVDLLSDDLLADRLAYWLTFPYTLVGEANRAEEQMSPDPVLEEAIGRGAAPDPEALSRELTSLLDSADPAQRLYGLARLRRIGAHAGRLTELLADPASMVRCQAARTVGRLGCADAVPALRRMIRDDPEPLNRLTALETLAAMDRPGELPFLIELARLASSPFVRAKACELIAGHRDPRVVEALVERLDLDDEWLVRDEAASGLQRLTRLDLDAARWAEPAGRRQQLGRLQRWCDEQRIEVRLR